MTNFEKFKSMSIDEFAEWIDRYGEFDGSPWLDWWNVNYCNDCESEFITFVDTGKKAECAWCEVYDKCKYFKELQGLPNDKQIIKMWLKTEIE